MSVPRYQAFIEPILRFLAACETAVAAGALYEAAAQTLQLGEGDRTLRLRSGTLTYKNRAAWALNTLKHAGLVTAPEVGMWQLTSSGREFAALNPRLTERQVSQLASSVTRSSQQKRTRDLTGKVISSERQTGGDRKAYRLQPRPLSVGGQAEVYEAHRKSDSKTFVLKRVRGKSGEPRMRREIEVQSSLNHDNIMPILDWDMSSFRWYVMPKGTRVMSDLARPVPFDTLLRIAEAVAAGLEFAHALGHPHRDVKPDNIIELTGDDGLSRWVLADWGLTRRPLGETQTAITRTGHVLGTEGFAPPEAYQDAHQYGESGDIFALGQVIAWATGGTPVPNTEGKAPEPWRHLVALMTKLQASERIQTMTEVRRWLDILRTSGK